MKNTKIFILIVALLIVTCGILSIYSSTYQKEGELWRMIYRQQIIWVIFSLCAFFVASNLDYRRLWDWTYFLYGLSLFFLILVFVLGIVRLGAQRWIRIGWLNFQPSEFAKLVMVIFLAKYFSKKSTDDISLLSKKFGIFRGLVLPSIFVLIPMGLIVEQPDLGSGMLLLGIFIVMLYLTGVRIKYLIILLVVLLLPLPLWWHYLRDYQKERLLVFLNPNIDPLGAGYTIIQSKIAIGSSFIFGKGWLAGTQSQLHFLPESHTDFIFATFVEEWGLAGCVFLLSLYFLLIRKGFSIALRTNDQFGKLLACGISLMLLVQLFINIAMNLGLAPVVGVPLPLMSYGGSSLFITFIALGILVNIDRRRAVF
ncbi:MAG: rod shape-determining protein RodA [Candidatus Omnitrophica bacterium]|nr:rod shape-determining protein RodA [Candidatus Omnitrophota bacterium]MBU1869963.1 rod shape-determining protein RodA [Candidatus Omnitrophota bacterium]